MPVIALSPLLGTQALILITTAVMKGHPLDLVMSLTHATELVLQRPGFSETFDQLHSTKWSRRWVKMI